MIDTFDGVVVNDCDCSEKDVLLKCRECQQEIDHWGNQRLIKFNNHLDRLKVK